MRIIKAGFANGQWRLIALDPEGVEVIIPTDEATVRMVLDEYGLDAG